MPRRNITTGNVLLAALQVAASNVPASRVRVLLACCLTPRSAAQCGGSMAGPLQAPGSQQCLQEHRQQHTGAFKISKTDGCMKLLLLQMRLTEQYILCSVHSVFTGSQ
jgi:hypothetical protein